MREIKTEVYSFEELSEGAKKFALDDNRYEREVFLDGFKEGCIETIKEAGFEGNIVINCSLSCSQGDGLSFKADNYTKLFSLFKQVLGEGKDKTINCILEYCDFTLKGNTGRYCYSSDNDLTLELNGYNLNPAQNVEEIVEKVQEKLRDIYTELCANFETDGYAEIEYQHSDEYLIEDFASDEIEFTSNGKIFKG